MAEPQDQTTRPKPFAFVLMPFHTRFLDTFRVIQEACKETGAYAQRVDEQVFGKSILEQIYNQIAKADLIVADMTGQNPNVFYEVGYAHALGKRVILLTRKMDDIPFDLRQFRHIVYGEENHEILRSELPKWVLWALEHPEAASQRLQELQLDVQGKRVVGTPVIGVVSSGKRRSDLELILNIHNSVEHVIRVAEFKLAVLTSDSFSMMRASQAGGGAPSIGYSTSAVSREGQSQTVHLIRDKFVLMPGEWESLSLEFAHRCSDGAAEEVVFQVLTDSGEQSYPCILKIRR